MSTPEKKEPVIHCPYDELVPINVLLGKKHPRNTNKHGVDQLKRIGTILLYQGWRLPVTISKRSGFITRGHGRVDGAFMAAIGMAPVSYQDYESEAQELADLVADNVIAREATMDKVETKNVLADIRVQVSDINIEVTGFSADAVEEMFEEKEKRGPEYPITPRLNEHYNYVVVFTENDTDWQFLKRIAGVRKEVSYKNKTIGVGRVVTFERFMESLRENKSSIVESEPGGGAAAKGGGADANSDTVDEPS
jgi:hypothetical protein